MRADARPLREDDSGAVIPLALFLTLISVGLLYYVLGVGDAVLYRRTMQDGADAGAFAASVVAAKGMNLHVLLNVVMAVTAGILLVIRSVEVLLEIVLAILHGLAASVVLSPKALPLIAALTPAESTVESVGDAVEQFVRVAHGALDVAHHAVQRGYPLLSEARAVDAMAFQDAYAPPVEAGFVLPVLGAQLPDGGRGLPVEKDAAGVLCDRAASGLGNRLRNVSSAVPRWLLSFLGGVVEKALRLGKRRTCDDDIVKPPRAVIRTRRDGTRVWLGQEEFQYRAYDIGEDPREGPWKTGEVGVRFAQGGGHAGRNAAYRAQALGRLGIAQSEYYFDGTEQKPEWLWKQRWRARLRRFRFRRDWLSSEMTGACAGARGWAFVKGLSRICEVVRDFSVNAISSH